MIGYLRGILRHVDGGEAVVDVGGVGYEVQVDRQTLAALGPVGEPAVLWVRTMVREDAITLHGFGTPEARQVFDLVIQVSGVGPRLGTQIVGGMPLAELVAAVREKDLRSLSKIPGVGKKIAERLVLELAAKFLALPIQTEPLPQGIPAALLDDLRSALANLGFGPRDVEAAIRKIDVPEGAVDLEDLVLRSLATLGPRQARG